MVDSDGNKCDREGDLEIRRQRQKEERKEIVTGGRKEVVKKRK